MSALSNTLRAALAVLAAVLLAAPSLVPAQDTPMLPGAPFEFGEAGDTLRILPTGRLLTVDNVIYTEGRTTVIFGTAEISADRMAIDIVTQELQAEGNVLLVQEATEVRCSAARFSFRDFEGVAWDVEGASDGIFFRTRRDDDAEGPAFQFINEDSALVDEGSFTFSGFPVSTWYIKADEVFVVFEERVFMRGATLYLRSLPDHLGITRDIPIFWFPAFTFRLDQASPWTFGGGYLSDYGMFLSLGYDYQYETLVPSWEDPTVYQTRSEGRIGLRSDLFSTGAIGVGMDYEYEHDFERHIGSLNVYGIRDPVRNVEEDTPEDSEDSGDSETRYIYRHRHNSVFGKTIWQLNADWMSDPDLYYDILERVGPLDEEEGRKPERRLRGAVTYLEDDYLVRLSGEIKDRVTLDRYQDFADPQDDNLNYDPDPNFEDDDDIETDGISSDRYGRVSQKIQGQVATQMLPFFRTPMFWQTRANAFRNLDSGFNEFDTGDDAFFTGGDLYSSLTHRMRLDGAGRFTWTNTGGVGIGLYNRSDDSLFDGTPTADPVDPDDPDPPTTTPGVVRVDGQRYLDDSTILVGEGDRELDYSEVDSFLLWAEYRSRLSARLSDSLSGYVQYTVRETMGDGPGEFFEFAGRQEAFEDVYDFPVEYHWIEAMLDYALAYPNLNAYAGAGYNLQDELAASEQEWYLSAGSRYINDTGEFDLDTRVTLDSRQVRDQQDPEGYQRAALSGGVDARYMPIHERYWAQLRINGEVPLDTDPVDQDDERDARFDEDDPDLSIEPLIGRQFGPKYTVEASFEYNTQINDIKEAGVTIIRDLYDAELGLFAGVRNNTADDRDDGDDDGELDRNLETDFRFSLTIKQPRERASLGAVSIQTMRDRERQASFVE